MKTWFIAEASQGLGQECALAAPERGDLVAVSAADATALNEPPLRVVIGNNAGLTDRGYRPADDARESRNLGPGHRRITLSRLPLKPSATQFFLD